MERSDGGRAACLQSLGGPDVGWEPLHEGSTPSPEDAPPRRPGRVRHATSSADLEALRGLQANEQWHAAARLAQRLLRKDPGHLCALEYLLEAQWHLGQLERVVSTATRLIAINPMEPCYYLLKGAALFSLNRPGVAMPCLRRALQLAQPGPLRAHVEQYAELINVWQGVILAELIGDNPALRAEFRRAPEATCQRFGLDFVGMASSPRRSHRESAVIVPARLS